MALARCETCGRPKGRKGNEYVRAHEPPNYLESGLVCGRSTCENPALVWLNNLEENSYSRGLRVFTLPTAAAKVRVT